MRPFSHRKGRPRAPMVCLAVAMASAVACAAPVPPEPARARICTPLSNPRGWSVSIVESGNYCLVQDLKQLERPAWLRLPHGTIPHEPMMSIGPGNVAIDLAGHSLVATLERGEGIRHRTGLTRADGIPHPLKAPARAIALRNGSIRTTRQPAVVMVHRWNDPPAPISNRLQGEPALLDAPASDAHGDLTLYQDTEYVLEDLTLTSDQFVVLMQGKRNTIRRCKIIGGSAAVNLFGPDLVFEDNEIVITARAPEDAGGQPQLALFVKDGTRALIRNNRFVIKGKPEGAVAMAFKNSPGVVLEGNTVEGKAGLYRLLDETSTVDIRPAAR